MSYDFYGNSTGNHQPVQSSSQKQQNLLQTNSFRQSQARSQLSQTIPPTQNDFFAAEQKHIRNQQPSVIPPPSTEFNPLNALGTMAGVPSEPAPQTQQQNPFDQLEKDFIQRLEQDRQNTQQFSSLNRQPDQIVVEEVNEDLEESVDVLDRDKAVEMAASRARKKSKRNQKRRKKQQNIDSQKAQIGADNFDAMHLDQPPQSTASTQKPKGKEQVGVGGDTSDSEESHEAELRIKAMQEAILYEEKRWFKNMAKAYQADKNIDMSSGRCCCKFDNEKGAKCVKALDLICLPNLPRWLFALWATIDSNRFPLYARMRMLSCWLFWVVSILVVIIYASIEVSTNEDVDTLMIINSLLVLTGLVICFLVDYHYSRVVLFYARGHNKRLERQNEEVAKLKVQEDALKRHTALVIDDEDLPDNSNITNNLHATNKELERLGQSFDGISQQKGSSALQGATSIAASKANQQSHGKSVDKVEDDWEKDMRLQQEAEAASQSSKLKPKRKKKKKAKLHPLPKEDGS